MSRAARKRPAQPDLEEVLARRDLGMSQCCTHGHLTGAEASAMLSTSGSDAHGWLVKRLYVSGAIRPTVPGIVLWGTFSALPGGQTRLAYAGRRFCVIDEAKFREQYLLAQAEQAERRLRG